ncbi:MAG TPA: hypothetical protein VF621_04450 [Pyrinomonadaceae bacterium]|jgi:hypothetical protein
MTNLLKNTAALLLLLLTLAPAAPGQRLRAAGAKAKDSGDEVEQLLTRYVLAKGGVELFKLRTRIVRGRVELSTSPLPGTFESYSKGMRKEMSIINAPIGQFISATDGLSHWRQAPWGAATKVGFGGGEDLLKESGTVKGGFKFRNAFSAARLKGRARVEGREMIVLAATPRGAKPLIMYFDAETYLLRKEEPDRAAGGWGESPLKAIYIDSYGSVDGVKVPALFRVVTEEFTLTFRVTEVRHNVEIDDALFRGPAGK